MEIENSDLRVQASHGGMSIGSRSDAHINYLTGKTLIIVATLAFGMGIDKSDRLQEGKLVGFAVQVQCIHHKHTDTASRYR